MVKTNRRKIEGARKKGNRKNQYLWKLRVSSMDNALALMDEAVLLWSHKHYARAYFLSYCAQEEVGKFLIVSDFITGVAAKGELDDAFKHHDIKKAYTETKMYIDTKLGLFSGQIPTLIYDKSKAKKDFHLRNASLYVEHNGKYFPKAPSKQINRKKAKQQINLVYSIIEFILYAEDLNGRIGSKAMWK